VVSCRNWGETLTEFSRHIDRTSRDHCRRFHSAYGRENSVNMTGEFGQNITHNGSNGAYSCPRQDVASFDVRRRFAARHKQQELPT
jgi:hypothetical protein